MKTTPQHTQEPWQVIREVTGEGSDYPHPLGLKPEAMLFVGLPGLTVAVIPPGLPNEEANAERIVSCVNACSGTADPLATINAMREALESSLACLENLDRVLHWNKQDGDHIDEAYEARDKCRAALNGGKEQTK